MTLPKYREKNRQKTAAMKARRTAAGLCTTCGVLAPQNPYKQCEPCLEKNRQLQKHYVQKRIEEKTCTGCGGERRPGYARCRKCSDASKASRQKRIDSGKCSLCGARPALVGIKTCQECREKSSAKTKLFYREQRKKILDHYGHSCACCGETIEEFLQIDHVYNNGNRHRDELNRYGRGFYQWLIDHNYPPEFQTLCTNCNFAKARHGECPHQRIAREYLRKITADED